MKKLLLILTILLCTGLTNAQPTPSEVVKPGAKGNLPQLTTISPAREGEIPILTLADEGFDPYIVNGWTHNEANLSFPLVKDVGCEYYTIQQRANATSAWETIMDGDTPRHYSENTVGTSVTAFAMYDYRLVLHGGEMDGYVSNIVTTKPLSMYSRYRSWSESPSVEHCMVGVPVGSQLSFSAETYQDGKITEYSTEENPEYFTYQWYLRNPNNGDITVISGATSPIYTPKVEDAGYQLVIEVGGDKKHLDFYLYHGLTGVVCVPVQASVAYIGPDGFILNTDYVIADPQKAFVLGETWTEETPTLDPNSISEVEAGTYKFRIPENQYNYGIYELSNPAYFLTFIYKGMGSEGEDWYREVQLMSDRYKGKVTVKAQLGETPVATTIDAIGKNIDGKWTVMASQQANAEEGIAIFEQDWETETDSRLFYGQYYLKARATDNTLETYYPATPLWEKATLIDVNFDNAWEGNEANILLQPIPAQMTGNGVIEGVISRTHATNRAPALSEEEETAIMVYLVDTSTGYIVAQVAADADGKFRFENVDYGTYQVVPNIDGCTLSAPAEVTLTAENPTVSDVSYSVTDTDIVPTGIRTNTLPAQNAVRSIWSLAGYQHATRGLNIVRMADGTVKKIVKK